jgi:hypothetical protein
MDHLSTGTALGLGDLCPNELQLKLRIAVNNILQTMCRYKKRRAALHHPSDIGHQSGLVNSLAGIIPHLWRHEDIPSGVCDAGHWDSSQWRRRCVCACNEYWKNETVKHESELGLMRYCVCWIRNLSSSHDDVVQRCYLKQYTSPHVRIMCDEHTVCTYVCKDCERWRNLLHSTQLTKTSWDVPLEKQLNNLLKNLVVLDVAVLEMDEMVWQVRGEVDSMLYLCVYSTYTIHHTLHKHSQHSSNGGHNAYSADKATYRQHVQ